MKLNLKYRACPIFSSICICNCSSAVVHLILKIFLSHCTDFCFNSLCMSLIACANQASAGFGKRCPTAGVKPGVLPEHLSLVCPRNTKQLEKAPWR